MNRLIYVIFFQLFCVVLEAQKQSDIDCVTFDCKYNQAKLEFKKKHYKNAIELASKALVIDDSKTKIIGTFTDKVLNQQKKESEQEISNIKKEAEQAQKIRKEKENEIEVINQEINRLNKICADTLSPKKEQDSIRTALEYNFKKVKNESDSIFNCLNQILSKLYFYKNSFSLAYDADSLRFGFIDRAERTKIRFIYEEALSFERNGYAKVKRDGDYYLIDTLGREYRLATEIADLNVSISAVDFRNKGLEVFPEELLNQTQINILLLANNKIEKLPKEISKLIRLKKIDLRNNNFRVFPLEITKVKSLQSLDISNNKIGTLPEAIGKMDSLQDIDLRSNKILKLPPSIGNLKQLEDMKLWANGLTYLPSEISSLSKLKSIDLSENEFIEFPIALTKTQSLVKLNISNNNIKKLPPEISNLKQLENLDISLNDIEILPETITAMTWLASLDVSNNQLKKLPSDIRKLREVVVISGNTTLTQKDKDALNSSKDSDGDGIIDAEDKCPNEKGLKSDFGCPKKIIDSDGDSIIDEEDKCPNEKGLKSNFGCPTEKGQNLKPNFTIKDLALTMVFVQGGTFMMGSDEKEKNAENNEKPQHKVTLSEFYIGKTEVTQKQWRTLMGTNPSEFKGCDGCPVENVSWNDIQKFLAVLNKKFPPSGGKGAYRLPTEAEWEYSARGGNKSKGYTYSGSNDLNDVAWLYNDKTHPVAGKKANELGLYDMSGNVWEWCSDWYGDYSRSNQTNPIGARSGSIRVFRGGSWLYTSVHCRTARRNYVTPKLSNYDIGFRVCFFSQ